MDELIDLGANKRGREECKMIDENINPSNY
jgi:hypothetical protein